MNRLRGAFLFSFHSYSDDKDILYYFYRSFFLFCLDTSAGSFGLASKGQTFIYLLRREAEAGQVPLMLGLSCLTLYAQALVMNVCTYLFMRELYKQPQSLPDSLISAHPAAIAPICYCPFDIFQPLFFFFVLTSISTFFFFFDYAPRPSQTHQTKDGRYAADGSHHQSPQGCMYDGPEGCPPVPPPAPTHTLTHAYTPLHSSPQRDWGL